MTNKKPCSLGVPYDEVAAIFATLLTRPTKPTRANGDTTYGGGVSRVFTIEVLKAFNHRVEKPFSSAKFSSWAVSHMQNGVTHTHTQSPFDSTFFQPRVK